MINYVFLSILWTLSEHWPTAYFIIKKTQLQQIPSRPSKSNDRRGIRLGYHSRKRGVSKESNKIEQEINSKINSNNSLNISNHSNLNYSNIRQASFKREFDDFKSDENSMNYPKRSVEGNYC